MVDDTANMFGDIQLVGESDAVPRGDGKDFVFTVTVERCPLNH